MGTINRAMKKVLIVVAIVAFSTVVVWAAPKPALVPPAGTWQLEFQLHGQPQQITITLPGSTEPKTYWYLLYTITNDTGNDVEFYPQFDLFTDTFQLYPAGIGVRRPVFEAIQKLYSNVIPLMEAEDMITDKILLGEDNARDSVAIFEDFDPNATSVKIMVSGLSNETVTLAHPTRVDEKTGEKEQVLLRKTLMLQYKVAGDKFKPEDRVLLYRNRDWIMR